MDRRRYYPPGLAELKPTETSNYAVQGGAADIANCTLVGDCGSKDSDVDLGAGKGMADALRVRYPSAWLAMHTYDSFDTICKERDAEGVKKLMIEYMEQPFDVGAGPRPFKVDVKIGYRWSEV